MGTATLLSGAHHIRARPPPPRPPPRRDCWQHTAAGHTRSARGLPRDCKCSLSGASTSSFPLCDHYCRRRRSHPVHLPPVFATTPAACAIFVMGAPDRGQGHGGNGDHGAAKDGKKHHDKSEGFSGGWHEQ